MVDLVEHLADIQGDGDQRACGRISQEDKSRFKSTSPDQFLEVKMNENIYIITAMYKKGVRVDGYERLVFMIRDINARGAVYRLLACYSDDLDRRTVKVVDEIPIEPNRYVHELELYPEDLKP